MDTVLSIFIGISVGALFCGGLMWLGDQHHADAQKKMAETQSSEFRV